MVTYLRHKFENLVNLVITIFQRVNQVTILQSVEELQVQLGELKGRLTEVMSNCDAICKRIAAEGPEQLQSSVKPFAVAAADLRTTTSHSSV